MSRIVPIVLSVALFMENMDSTVIATALATIAADIGTSPIALKLALTSYYVALAVFIPISGRLADRFGPRRVFRGAILVFMAGSLACAMAESLPGFVAARFLQGMGGAMMTPVGRLLLVRAVPRSELVGAMAWFTIPALVGPLVGPPVGGAIATWTDWRFIFLVNIPIGLLGLWLAGRHLPFVAPKPETRFDWPGFALSAAACAGIVFGASIVSLPALPPLLGVALLGAGGLAAFAYLAHARAHPAPLLDFRLARAPAFRAVLLAGFLFRLGVGATPFLLPLLLQLGFGFTPFESGLITCTTIAGALGMKFIVRRILARFGFRSTLALAALGGGLAMVPVAFWPPGAPLAPWLLALLAGGFLRSLFFTSLNALGFAETPLERTGDATALLAVGQQVSVALGVAVAGAVLETVLALSGRETLLPADFTAAFLVVTVFMLAAALPFRRLDPQAGAEVSGHRAAGRQPAE